VRHVAIVFRADELTDLFARGQIGHRLEAPRLRQDPGIFHRDILFQVPQVRTAVALDHVKLIGMGVRAGVHPQPIVEAGAVDDQSIAFPAPDRVAIPEIDVEFFGMRAAVQVYLMETGALVIRDNDHQLFGLRQYE